MNTAVSPNTSPGAERSQLLADAVRGLVDLATAVGDHERGRCKADKAIDGRQDVLREMGPGSVFGETAIISNLPRTATVEAISPMTVLVVTREMLEQGLGLETWLGNFVTALAHRFRDLDEKVTQLEAELMTLRSAELTELEA